MNKKYYLAYGSNLNVQQMAWRCPGATPVGTTTLEGWQLVFRGSGTGSYLSIEPCKGASVPLGVWLISDEDERSLDRYEGFPHFYYKKTMHCVPVQNHLTGETKTVDALVYIMHEDRPLGVPSRSYVQTCAQGYYDFYLDLEPLIDAVKRSIKEAV